ncbi:hypothetical protein [Nocardia arizonensis]|nr:hypothetical protein [Nocardia arizonensis]
MHVDVFPNSCCRDPCPEMTGRADVVREFAQLRTERRGTDIDAWIKRP